MILNILLQTVVTERNDIIRARDTTLLIMFHQSQRET